MFKKNVQLHNRKTWTFGTSELGFCMLTAWNYFESKMVTTTAR